MPADDDLDIEDVLFHLYRICINNYHMSLVDVDMASLETILDFLFYKPKVEISKEIGGKVYYKAKKNKAPSWL